MCGINGFNFKDEQLIQKMNDATRHRGPDDEGVFLSGAWSLGHNRLSIIDLSKAGHQPMESRDKKYVITYNGELYNYLDVKKELEQKGYLFDSKTDTEVILYAYQEWGADCLKRFNGMFAFAILNTETEELFLARDRIGIKPLYYYHKGTQFIFSSEVKAILRHNVDAPLNRDSLNIYFRLLYVPSPRTMWQNIFKLPPAHYAVVGKQGDIKLSRYWEVKNEPLLRDRESIKKNISELLHDSVKQQLMSDRPVGVFLSGGIDSTIITGIMSKLSAHVNTYSVGFEATEQAEKYNSDFLIARRTAQHFNTRHHEYIISAKDVVDNLEKTVYHMDEPISNHVQTVNLLLARYASESVKVVLGGDGGDELFGGYDRYYFNSVLDALQRIPRVLRRNSASKLLARALGKHNWYEKINAEPGVARYMSFFSQKEDVISSFLSGSANKAGVLPEFLREQYFQKIDAKDFTRQFMRTDIASWLADESLARSDKMSMAHGLEQRVPFLDHRLVEYADRIPVSYKVGEKGGGKMILREAMAEYLPGYVLAQPKWGWFSPAAKWLRGPLKPLMQEALSPSFCAGTRDLFNFEALPKILEDHISKKQYGLNTLWSIMTFQLWYRKFMEPPQSHPRNSSLRSEVSGDPGNPPLTFTPDDSSGIAGDPEKGGKWGGMPKRILIISPKFPMPTTGACEQERLAGFLQLKRLGFEVRIVSKVFERQDKNAIMAWGRSHGIGIDLIPYELARSMAQKITQLINPVNWDGAAYEYKLANTQHAVKNVIRDFQPDVAWFDYTYLYPLYHLFQEQNIPIITRSINIEPTHFLQEDGKSAVNLIKFLPKWYSELQTIKKSDYLFAITPNEERQYRTLGAKHVATLPLRSLPHLVKHEREIKERDVLHLFFMGASYNVHHNRVAAELVIKGIALEIEKRVPGKFFFHILGKKLPEDLSKLCRGNIKEEGFVDDLDAFLREQVDIAVIPSIMGAGMQQKIFEPLAYGIPSVVSERGIAGYPFKRNEHALFANTKNEFVEQILRLQGIALRRSLSKNALQLSQELFSQERFDRVVIEGLNAV